MAPTKDAILLELFNDKKITVARVAALKACLDELSPKDSRGKGNSLEQVSDSDLNAVLKLVRKPA